MRRLIAAAGLLLVLFVVACSQGSSNLSSTAPSRVENQLSTPAASMPGAPSTVATPSTAEIQFGKPNVGSNFPPAPPHDQSAHAKDDMVPRTVVIDQGGTVTIRTFGVHQVAIYDDGTEPGDIDQSDLILTGAGCPKPGGAPLLIDDDTNRIVLYNQACGPNERVIEQQFDEPGRYLVICAFLPHFQVQMYGWVIVRDR